MEDYAVNLLIGAISVVAIFVTNKVQTQQNQKDIEEIKGDAKARKQTNEALHSKIFDKLDALNEEVAKHKVLLVSAPSMKDVDEKFVSKEMFKQMEKHIDDKFDNMGKSLQQVIDNQEKMLNKMEK